MSTLHANTVETSSGGAVTLTQQNAAKCFGSATMNGTAALFSGSLNASSLTDNGTGTGTVAFTNNFSNATHSYQFNGKYDSTSVNDDIPIISHYRQSTSASNVKFVAQQSNSTSAYDADSVTFTVHGDLA